MGSPSEQGRCWDGGPQHKVTLESFYFSRTPVTQAQWHLVAGWQLVQRALRPDPSQFKGAHRPVEQVSWHEAQAFCLRLSRCSGKHYVLPSEAQWEYACRAGPNTPFHFGAMLTADQANFDDRQGATSLPMASPGLAPITPTTMASFGSCAAVPGGLHYAIAAPPIATTLPPVSARPASAFVSAGLPEAAPSQ